MFNKSNSCLTKFIVSDIIYLETEDNLEMRTLQGENHTWGEHY